MNILKKTGCLLAVLLLSLQMVCAQADTAAGDMITFGSWHQYADAMDSTPIQWRVLEVQDDRALLISDNRRRMGYVHPAHLAEHGVSQRSLYP